MFFKYLKKKIPTLGYVKKCGREDYLKEELGQYYRINLLDEFDRQLSLSSPRKNISSYELLRSDSTG